MVRLNGRGRLARLALAVVAGGWLQGGVPASAADTVIRNVRLIDGLGDPATPPTSVLIHNGLIAAVEPDVRAPHGARVLDLAGRTLMPGIISDHSHVGLVDGVTAAPEHYTRRVIQRQLRQYQAFGVTTVTSLGLNRSPLFETLRAQAHADPLSGADLFGADQGVGAPDGAPPRDKLPVADDQLFRPATPAQARADVDLMAARGSDLVKLWFDDLRNNTDKAPSPKILPAVYQAVIAEAHAKGLRVAAHVYDLEDAKTMVAAGVDILAHGVRDRLVDAAFVEAMKSRGVWYIPTLSLDESGYLFAERPELLQDPFLAAALQPQLLAELEDPAWRARTLSAPATAGARQAVAFNKANLKTLYDAGVKIGFGDDSGAAATRIPGFAEHRELELLVEAGLTPMQALSLATSRAAALLNRSDRGALVPGRRADFIVLRADPSADIRNSRRIEAVWRGGIAVGGPVLKFHAEPEAGSL